MQIINLESDKFTFLLDKNDFFEKLYLNYQTSQIVKNKILKQFLIDFNREQIYINNICVNNLFTYFELINQITHQNPILELEILQMSQQTPFSIPLECLSKLIEPNIICELKKYKGMQIEINSFGIKIKKKLQIFNPNTITTISKLNIEITYFFNTNVVNIDCKIKKNHNHGFEIL